MPFKRHTKLMGKKILGLYGVTVILLHQLRVFSLRVVGEDPG